MRGPAGRARNERGYDGEILGATESGREWRTRGRLREAPLRGISDSGSGFPIRKKFVAWRRVLPH